MIYCPAGLVGRLGQLRARLTAFDHDSPVAVIFGSEGAPVRTRSTASNSAWISGAVTFERKRNASCDISAANPARMFASVS